MLVLRLCRSFLSVPRVRSASTTSSPSPSAPSSSSSSPSSSLSKAPLPALRFHQRRVLPGLKKKLRPTSQIPEKDRWDVVGYSTAEGYDLFTLAEKLEEQGLYTVEPLAEDLLPLCLYARAKYNFEEEVASGDGGVKDMFFFENGSVVFWSVPELERDSVLNFLKKVEADGYSETTIQEEAEMMPYKHTEGSSSLQAGVIRLHSASPEAGKESPRARLEKYAFSNGMAASVKLGALESLLDRVVDSIEHISEDLKRGKTVKMSRKEVLQKAGEIFALRHELNLSSDLLDTPDFYWDREDLERLYLSTCTHLAIGKRTRVMNEKLIHCCELMDLITNHLNDEHHVRLEWFIIILILIEVVFEILHFIERYLI